MMNFKIIALIIIILIQVISYLKNQKVVKILPLLILDIYTIKPIIESSLSFFDSVFTKIILLCALVLLSIKIVEGKKIKYDKYLLYFLLLIIINGLYNAFLGNTISSLYIQGLANYSFILILVVFFMNTIDSNPEFKSMLQITKFNGILIFSYAIYDTFVMGLQRTGGDVNPNYFAQMSIILLLFYFYSAKKPFSLKSIIYYFMLVFSIVSTGSSSGILALLILIASIFLFLLKSEKIIMISNYVFWIVMLFFIGVIIFTSNYEFGILKYFVKSTDLSRIFIWQYTFDYILYHPFMGVLYNTFRAPWSNLEMVTHNDYLRLGVELGIGGILILFFMVKRQIHNITKFNFKDGFFLYSLIMITLAFSLSHNNLNNFMFWFALVLSSILHFDTQKINESGGNKNEII